MVLAMLSVTGMLVPLRMCWLLSLNSARALKRDRQSGQPLRGMGPVQQGTAGCHEDGVKSLCSQKPRMLNTRVISEGWWGLFSRGDGWE